MARLVAVAFGQASMPLHQIQALRVCRHTLAVALKLDFFIWELVHVQGVTAIADLIAATEQFHSDGARLDQPSTWSDFPEWPAAEIARFKEEQLAQAMDVEQSADGEALPTDRCAMKALGVVGKGKFEGQLCESSVDATRMRKEKQTFIARTAADKPDPSGPWVCKGRCGFTWRQAGKPCSLTLCGVAFGPGGALVGFGYYLRMSHTAMQGTPSTIGRLLGGLRIAP
jgi:hypothetical protein